MNCADETKYVDGSVGWDGEGSAVGKGGFNRVLGHRFFAAGCFALGILSRHGVSGMMDGWDGMRSMGGLTNQDGEMEREICIFISQWMDIEDRDEWKRGGLGNAEDGGRGER